MGLRAVLFDLGDVIMKEETEEKVDDVTQRADLHPGMGDLIIGLRERGMPLGLVADTRDGTYRNVLRQHGLWECFDVFAISDHLGVVKPDRLMFVHALEGLGIPEPNWPEVAMVGNNLARDIRGANALGLVSIWLLWNQRYPSAPSDALEEPRFQVSTATELDALLAALRDGDDALRFAWPRPFPWLVAAMNDA
jgi:HAD superfamily hydrolase (TIGR01549 family)